MEFNDDWSIKWIFEDLCVVISVLLKGCQGLEEDECWVRRLLYITEKGDGWYKEGFVWSRDLSIYIFREWATLTIIKSMGSITDVASMSVIVCIYFQLQEGYLICWKWKFHSFLVRCQNQSEKETDLKFTFELSKLQVQQCCGCV